jgi:hypothetical protein
MNKGLLLSKPFEKAGDIACIRFHVDPQDESRVLFATPDEVLWLSPLSPAPRAVESRSPRLFLPRCLTLV